MGSIGHHFQQSLGCRFTQGDLTPNGGEDAGAVAVDPLLGGSLGSEGLGAPVAVSSLDPITVAPNLAGADVLGTTSDANGGAGHRSVAVERIVVGRGGRCQPTPVGSERHQLIQFPLGHGGNVAAAVLCQPAVDVLAGGHAPLRRGADPTLARHQGGNGGLVGEQNAGPVCQFHFGAGDGHLLEAHGGSGGELKLL